MEYHCHTILGYMKGFLFETKCYFSCRGQWSILGKLISLFERKMCKNINFADEFLVLPGRQYAGRRGMVFEVDTRNALIYLVFQNRKVISFSPLELAKWKK